MASHKIWRTATVGGNVCLALPAGAVLAVLVALDAVAVVWPRAGGERRILLREFVTGPGRTVLAEGEVLRVGFDGVPAPDAVAAAVAGLDPRLWFDDPHGAPDWRAHVTGLLARQVVAELNGGAAP
ncbi:Putative oxidoreductase (molybdopterin dehydrogenase?) [Mycobacteroides abscessus subsp. abscessus]|nr:Putative oxidoreductase (molybdopterin dehydrogenase?) [Mycobacteroides abscessus subsp. abscessus]